MFGDCLRSVNPHATLRSSGICIAQPSPHSDTFLPSLHALLLGISYNNSHGNVALAAGLENGEVSIRATNLAKTNTYSLLFKLSVSTSGPTGRPPAAVLKIVDVRDDANSAPTGKFAVASMFDNKVSMFDTEDAFPLAAREP